MFRHSGRKSRWEVRQFVGSNPPITLSVNAGMSGLLDTVLFAPRTYTASPTSAKLQKDFTIAFKSFTSDVMSSNGTQVSLPCALSEWIYLADVNTATANLYTALQFNGLNECAGADPAGMPTRVLFRRYTLIDGLFGVSASEAINWVPPRIRVKQRVKENQAIFWRVEINNPGTVNSSWSVGCMAAVAIKANP